MGRPDFAATPEAARQFRLSTVLGVTALAAPAFAAARYFGDLKPEN